MSITKSHHISLSISGALAMSDKDFKKQFKNVFYSEEKGRYLKTDELKAELLERIEKGQKIIPSAGCDNFSWETGCKGHLCIDGVKVIWKNVYYSRLQHAFTELYTGEKHKSISLCGKNYIVHGDYHMQKNHYKKCPRCESKIRELSNEH